MAPIGMRDDGFHNGRARQAVPPGAQWRGVCFHHAAVAFAIDDPHDHSARTGRGELGDDRYTQPGHPEGDGDDEAIGLVGKVVVTGR